MSSLLHLPFTPRKAGSAPILGRGSGTSSNFEHWQSICFQRRPGERCLRRRSWNWLTAVLCDIGQSFLFPCLKVAVSLGPETLLLWLSHNACSDGDFTKWSHERSLLWKRVMEMQGVREGQASSSRTGIRAGKVPSSLLLGLWAKPGWSTWLAPEDARLSSIPSYYYMRVPCVRCLFCVADHFGTHMAWKLCDGRAMWMAAAVCGLCWQTGC